MSAKECPKVDPDLSPSRVVRRGQWEQLGHLALRVQGTGLDASSVKSSSVSDFNFFVF